MKGDEWMRPANKWLERTMLGVTSLAGASAAPLARRSATPLGRPGGETKHAHVANRDLLSG
jgi:hypothetical protein